MNCLSTNCVDSSIDLLVFWSSLLVLFQNSLHTVSETSNALIIFVCKLENMYKLLMYMSKVSSQEILLFLMLLYIHYTKTSL